MRFRARLLRARTFAVRRPRHARSVVNLLISSFPFSILPVAGHESLDALRLLGATRRVVSLFFPISILRSIRPQATSKRVSARRVAAWPGFEPELGESKSPVLPLHHQAVARNGLRWADRKRGQGRKDRHWRGRRNPRDGKRGLRRLSGSVGLLPVRLLPVLPFSSLHECPGFRCSRSRRNRGG